MPVEINESVVKVKHSEGGVSQSSKASESNDESPRVVSSNVDVDFLVDICVERVFELLRLQNER